MFSKKFGQPLDPSNTLLLIPSDNDRYTDITINDFVRFVDIIALYTDNIVLINNTKYALQARVQA